jgi:hypothetical protein
MIENPSGQQLRRHPQVRPPRSPDQDVRAGAEVGWPGQAEVDQYGVGCPGPDHVPHLALPWMAR